MSAKRQCAECAAPPTGPSHCAGRVIRVLAVSDEVEEGPNQYTERQQARRARVLRQRAGWRRLRDRRGVDILLSHGQPALPPHAHPRMER